MTETSTKSTNANSLRTTQVIIAVVIGVLFFVATTSLINGQNKLLRERQAIEPTPTPTSKLIPTKTPKPSPTSKPVNFPTLKSFPTFRPLPTRKPLPTLKPLPTIENRVNCELSYGNFNLYESVCFKAQQEDHFDSYQQAPNSQQPTPDYKSLNTACKNVAEANYNAELSAIINKFAAQGTIDSQGSGSYEEAVRPVQSAYDFELNKCDYYYPVSTE